ncbi:MAG TPA: PEGA domain-containing protein [Kofleriaceae bacterium]|nr:PEGA domain-containing protein [Kofleriaceae bacterium]
MNRALAVVVLAALAGCTHPGPAPGAPREAPLEADPTTAPPPPGTAPATNLGATPPAVPPKPVPAKVRVIVRSKPPKALVFWGKKKLGETPVTLERPRDSGPVDLIVRSEGFFPVHTRAYTFRNDTLYVQMTKLEERMSLFGAKEEPAPTESPDGGTPAPAAPAVPAPGAPAPPAPVPPAPAPPPPAP